MPPTHRIDAVIAEDGKLSLDHLPFRAGQVVEVSVSAAPEFDSPEWAEMNRRRGELIHKKNRQGLSGDEQDEYDRLQRVFRLAQARAFPPPAGIDDEVARLEAKLGGERSSSDE